MIVKEIACNICGEKLTSVEEMIGIEQDNNCVWKETHLEATDVHLCFGCIEEVHKFMTKFLKKRKENS